MAADLTSTARETRGDGTYRSCLLALLVSCTLPFAMAARELREPVTIDDLVGRVQIPLVSLSPDGSRVAYLALQGLALQNEYQIWLKLQDTNGKSMPLTLSEYRLAPECVLEADTGELEKSAGQFAWSPDSNEVAYSIHQGPQMEVRVRSFSNGSEKLITKGFDKVEIWSKNGHLKVTTTNPVHDETTANIQPQDLALLVKDGFRFFGPPSNGKNQGKFTVQQWDYIWGSPVASKSKEPDSVSYFGLPKEWVGARPASTDAANTADATTISRNVMPSPKGSYVAVLEEEARSMSDPLRAYRTSEIVLENLKNDNEHRRVLVPSERPRAILKMLGWSSDGEELYYVSLGPRWSSLNAVNVAGTSREIYREESGFSLPNPSSEISDDRRTIALVRTTNLIPDELVTIDSKSGVLTVLWSPNDSFKTRAQPIIRFIRIDCCDADFYGRLYLPSDYAKTTRYPLVFTNHYSGPGFDASVGDEVPIPALVAQGIAVFAMNSREANITSTSGDFRFEISRVEKPLRAMEWVYRRLSEEGLIDPERCGLTGLSYGAEIAMYAYWKSKIFRAVSVASGSWEPMDYELGGLSYSTFLDARGFAVPDVRSYSKWKDLSAGLNARSNPPPLLLQSADGEEYFTIETWFYLRRARAPVEWHVYPTEGHVKRSPANRWWVYQRNLDWFRFWLQGAEDQNPAKADQYKRWRELRTLQSPTNEESR